MQAAEPATALAEAATLASAFAGASDAAVTGYSIIYPVQFPPTRQSPILGSSDGLMVFGTATPDQLFALNIPNVREILFIDDAFDTSAAVIQTLIDLMIDNIWQNPFDCQLTTFLTGIRQTKE